MTIPIFRPQTQRARSAACKEACRYLPCHPKYPPSPLSFLLAKRAGPGRIHLPRPDRLPSVCGGGSSRLPHRTHHLLHPSSPQVFRKSQLIWRLGLEAWFIGSARQTHRLMGNSNERYGSKGWGDRVDRKAHIFASRHVDKPCFACLITAGTYPPGFEFLCPRRSRCIGAVYVSKPS